MGVDAADYDQDGWVDLFVTNVDREMYSLYHNNQDETFDDMAIPNGIGRVTRLMSGWGVKYFDFDNDGSVDLFLANGHPDDKIEVHSTEVKYYEPMLLFQGNGKRFQDVSATSGPAFSHAYASRGMAVGDFNNDGALDVLVGINNGAPLLLKNNAGRRNHWVGIKLIAKQSNPDGIGAQITWQAGDLKRSIYKTGGGSYLAAHDPRVVLGIGGRRRIDWVQVKWPLPSGRIERFTDVPVDQYTTLVEGRGTRV
jgi:enediyne biosynthesis protein E4